MTDGIDQEIGAGPAMLKQGNLRLQEDGVARRWLRRRFRRALPMSRRPGQRGPTGASRDPLPSLARHRHPVSLLIYLRLELEPPVTAELACSMTRMDRY